MAEGEGVAGNISEVQPETPVDAVGSESQEAEPLASENSEQAGSEESSGEESAEQQSDEQDGSEQSEEEKKAQEEAIKKLFKLKVDGEEIEEEVDLSDEDYLKEQLQMAKAAKKRMQEADELKKNYGQLEQEVQDFVDQLKNNPKEILRDPNIGVDLKQLANDVLNEEIEESKKSEEEKEKEKLEKELEEKRKKLEEIENQKKQEEFEKIKNEEAQRLESEINNAIEEGDLPNSPYVVKKMADMMAVANEQGIDVSANDVAPVVKTQIQQELSQVAQVLPEDSLEQFVGKDRVSKLAKKYASQNQPKKAPETAKQVKDTGADVKPKENKEKNPQPMSEFFSKLGSGEPI